MSSKTYLTQLNMTHPANNLFTWFNSKSAIMFFSILSPPLGSESITD